MSFGENGTENFVQPLHFGAVWRNQKKEVKEFSSPPLENFLVCGNIRILGGNVAQSVEQLTFNP